MAEGSAIPQIYRRVTMLRQMRQCSAIHLPPLYPTYSGNGNGPVAMTMTMTMNGSGSSGVLSGGGAFSLRNECGQKHGLVYLVCSFVVTGDVLVPRNPGVVVCCFLALT